MEQDTRPKFEEGVELRLLDCMPYSYLRGDGAVGQVHTVVWCDEEGCYRFIDHEGAHIADGQTLSELYEEIVRESYEQNATWEIVE